MSGGQCEGMLRTTDIPPSPTRATSIRNLGLLGLLGIAGVLALGIVIRSSGNGPSPLDSWWHDLQRGWRTDAGIHVAEAFDLIGGVGIVIGVTVVLITTLLIARRFRSAITLAVAMAVSETVTAAIKVVIARPRPADSLSDVDVTSFPSGHTAAAATLAVTLALLIGRRFWAPAIAWIVLMAWSRTFLEAHWLSDVIAGGILGASVALLARWLVVTATTTAATRLRRSAPAARRRARSAPSAPPS